MTKLTFDIEGVRKLAEHALAAPKHGRGYGDTGPAKPGLYFVKDEGIYLMSNGEPALPGARGLNFVVFAKGFDPAVVLDRGELHDKCSDAVGGDDFGELLTLNKQLVEWIRDPDAERFYIRCGADRMTLGIEKKKRPPRVRRATALAGLAPLLARPVAWVGKKKGDRKVKLWSNKTAIEPVRLKFMLAKDYPGAVVLTGKTPEEALAIYAEATGVQVID